MITALAAVVDELEAGGDDVCVIHPVLFVTVACLT